MIPRLFLEETSIWRLIAAVATGELDSVATTGTKPWIGQNASERFDINRNIPELTCTSETDSLLIKKQLTVTANQLFLMNTQIVYYIDN